MNIRWQTRIRLGSYIHLGDTRKGHNLEDAPKEPELSNGSVVESRSLPRSSCWLDESIMFLANNSQGLAEVSCFARTLLRHRSDNTGCLPRRRPPLSHAYPQTEEDLLHNHLSCNNCYES